MEPLSVGELQDRVDFTASRLSVSETQNLPETRVRDCRSPTPQRRPPGPTRVPRRRRDPENDSERLRLPSPGPTETGVEDRTVGRPLRRPGVGVDGLGSSRHGESGRRRVKRVLEKPFSLGKDLKIFGPLLPFTYDQVS